MASVKKESVEAPIILYETPSDWLAWLEENHADSQGVWVRIAKKGSGITSTDYAQTLEGALCYGWIDGQKKSYDDTSWLQKFTPRRPKSIWSKINVDKVVALIESGQMQPAGMRAVDAAQADGRWQAAYESQRNAKVPEDLQAALDANVEAKKFFGTLSGSNRYAILFRIHQSKKAETRAKRISDFVAMLERHETVYPT